MEKGIRSHRISYGPDEPWSVLTEFIKGYVDKRLRAQILSHKIFSFCEQTLQMGANDASGQRLQSALKNRHQNNFSR